MTGPRWAPVTRAELRAAVWQAVSAMPGPVTVDEVSARAHLPWSLTARGLHRLAAERVIGACWDGRRWLYERPVVA